MYKKSFFAQRNFGPKKAIEKKTKRKKTNPGIFNGNSNIKNSLKIVKNKCVKFDTFSI